MREKELAQVREKMAQASRLAQARLLLILSAKRRRHREISPAHM